MKCKLCPNTNDLLKGASGYFCYSCFLKMGKEHNMVKPRLMTVEEVKRLQNQKRNI